jgi:tetratricopeptide (TPR) repeat protein
MAKAKQTQKPAGDPVIEAYAEGLSALQNKDWPKAAELLEKVVAESDRLDLKDRARQLLAACLEKIGLQGKDAKGKKGKEAPAEAAEAADPFLTAVYEKNRGNHQAALEISRQGGRDTKDERFAYLVAAILAAESRTDEAVRALTKAIELNPKNRIHAYHDPDFAELRKAKEHRPLFGLS